MAVLQSSEKFRDFFIFFFRHIVRRETPAPSSIASVLRHLCAAPSRLRSAVVISDLLVVRSTVPSRRRSTVRRRESHQRRASVALFVVFSLLVILKIVVCSPNPSYLIWDNTYLFDIKRMARSRGAHNTRSGRRTNQKGFVEEIQKENTTCLELAKHDIGEVGKGDSGRARGGHNGSNSCHANERGTRIEGNHNAKHNCLRISNSAQRIGQSTTILPQHEEDDNLMVGEGGQGEVGNRNSIRASNSIENGSLDVHLDHLDMSDNEYEIHTLSRDEDTRCQTGKRKRANKFTTRVAMALHVEEVDDHGDIEERPQNNFGNAHIENNEQQGRGNGHISAQSAINETAENAEATSITKKRGERGIYKSYVVDMKIKGNKSKLKISIPNEIDRAIGENARHLVNECGRIVRTKAPLNVKNWQEAFAQAGDGMWKEIQGKFDIQEGGNYLKMQAFVVDTMQRIYRLWKSRLHYYYKSAKCGETDEERLQNPPPDLPPEQWEYCVKRFGSPEFKAISERNSKNRLSTKRCKHTTGNLSFAEAEDILTKENNNVKPSADVIWLAQHTRKNKVGVLEWADDNQSKDIHEKLKNLVATSGDTKSQEEILLEVLPARSGYFRGKGTTIRPFTKGRQQLHQQQILDEQQERIKQQDQRIKELEENQKKQFEDYKEQQQRDKEQQQREMEAFKQQMLEQFATFRDVGCL